MDVLLIIWIIIGTLLFFVVLRIPPPYGRFANRKWGPLLNDKIAWAVMESPSPILFAIIYLYYRFQARIHIVFFVLWEIHYIYRAFIYPFIFRSNEKKTPLSVIFMAIFFNLINSFFNSYYTLKFVNYSEEWIHNPLFICGIILFVGGFSLNIFSETKLISIKKREGIYRLPEGFPFNILLCPHYFGEIVEWGGWAILTSSLAGLSFFIWTCANLIPRAIHHFRWYSEHYPERLHKRRAVIPFII